ncbi:DUF2017 family protein [Actinomyces oris]|uniref:DUF2017 family protein n=1 Tax=Actinomyces oris TaxID=544580 RepID=A0A508BJP7_9ACTO|nr:DUF2017 family protein [Actinomyces oris]QQC38684.1 DUF2017 family protein [Actinomyces oris]TQD60851.1 DUF2017 family protein [Actinomyces oris]
MRAFRRVPEGLVCGLDDWERELLARLALEVRALLQADAPPTPGPGQSETSSSSRPDPVRPGESERDREVLEALDFDLDPPTNRVHSGRPNTDPVIAVLLPQASEDPITAMEVSSLTRARLRGDKVDRLASLAAELRAPSGPEGTVLVAPGQESDWLGASNDIRLVLAQRLGIESAQDAEHVHATAFQEAPEEETSREQWYRGTALVYDMVTWWQESLVSALFGGTGPA